MTTEPNDITADDIIPPVSAGRVRGIARVWLKPQAMKAEADLMALAIWLDRYHAMMREVLKESDAGAVVAGDTNEQKRMEAK